MSSKQLAPIGIDQPLTILSETTGSASQAIAHEVGEESWLAAVGPETAGAVPASRIAELAGSADLAGNDAGAYLTGLYRNLNAELAGRSEPLPLVTAVSRGKYVTVANIGDTGAFLVRASRLNRVTKEPDDRRVSGLGVAEKLPARQPEIYELTLLPEDLLVLCNPEACDQLQHLGFRSASGRQLVGEDALNNLTSGLSEVNGAAAALAVLPVREIATVPVSGDRSWLLPVVIAALIILAAVAIFLLV